MSRSQRHNRAIHKRDSAGTYPSVLTLPTKSGTPTNGQTLTGVNGTFRGKNTTVTRQWVREVVATGAQVVIGGATGATYVLQAADVGKRVRFQNTVKNKFGTRVVQSTPTATVP
jgi:hypothetical protein